MTTMLMILLSLSAMAASHLANPVTVPASENSYDYR